MHNYNFVIFRRIQPKRGLSPKLCGKIWLKGAVQSTPKAPEFFSFASSAFRARWEALELLFAKAKNSPYKWVNRDTKGAYMWVKCEHETMHASRVHTTHDEKRIAGAVTTCVERIAAAVKIVGLSGVPFGATADYVRFTLLGPTAEFGLFAQKIAKLLEGGGENPTGGQMTKEMDRVFNLKSAAELAEQGWNPIWV